MVEIPISVKKLKEGTYVTIDGEPCKVVSMVKSKAGKHGSAKVRFDAVGIFDDKKRCIIKPGSADMMSPVIEKKAGQVISVSGDIVQLMDMTDYSTFEARIPEELKGKIQPGIEITYWKFDTKILLKG